MQLITLLMCLPDSAHVRIGAMMPLVRDILLYARHAALCFYPVISALPRMYYVLLRCFFNGKARQSNWILVQNMLYIPVPEKHHNV